MQYCERYTLHMVMKNATITVKNKQTNRKRECFLTPQMSHETKKGNATKLVLNKKYCRVNYIFYDLFDYTNTKHYKLIIKKGVIGLNLQQYHRKYLVQLNTCLR